MVNVQQLWRCTQQMRAKQAILCLGLLAPFPAIAQHPCSAGVRIEGTVTDPTGALVSGALVQTADGEKTESDKEGSFTFSCVPGFSTTITVQAQGFDTATLSPNKKHGDVVRIQIQLAIAHLETDVQVGDDATAMDADHGAGTRTLSTNEIRQLADDPDDFQRQLQALAASGGGVPGSAIIVVDGFQNASAIPPKGSIASIRVNPDLFSPEYETAPYEGGRIEIFTKPGADAFHGALFFTDSDGSFNATDPFSLTATPASKRRYGFELSGPIIPKKGDFTVALEKRDINEFNVVNAITLSSDNEPAPLQQSVPAPQQLWIGSARNDWQLSPKDVATISFAANVNNLSNQGVGGLTLAEGGYSSLVGEYDLHFSNVLTLSPNLLHETRVGYTWKRTEQNPLSTAPSIQVAGYFTGGGSTAQNLNDRERDLEIDDDLMISHGKHEIKFGAQSLGLFVHDYDPNTFNGAYVFGGGSAPVLDANNNATGQTTTITGIEQYRRALLNLPGGAPTTYQLTSGPPVIPFTQWQLGLYAQDGIKLTDRVTLSGGLRYQFQTAPNSFVNFSPRVGLAWSPDKKASWVFHIRAGIFHAPNPLAFATEAYRLSAGRQHQVLVYSSNYNDPLTPSPNSIQVGTVNEFARSVIQPSSLQTHLSVEHNFRGGWHSSTTFYWTSGWNRLRTKNMNAPLVSDTNGVAPDPTDALLAPRPLAPNENILQYQNSGHLMGNILVTGADRSNGKRFDISVYYVHLNMKTDTASTPAILSPQSSYREKGESSTADWQNNNAIYATGGVHLPYKIELSSILDWESGMRFNITTGTDANGDGDFNDRPSFAIAPGPGVYSTRYGLLTTNAVNGDVSRNRGRMPGVLHLDSNLTRAFLLNPKDKDHPRTLTLNLRSANVLNHTNVTAVNTVLSSGALGQPITAETARRIELGVRFSF